MEKPHGYIAGAFAAMLPILQEKVRPIGYALAVHGPMNRDFDLIAVPWDDTAVATAKDVHDAIFCAISPYRVPNVKHGPEKKPHGRMSWIIPLRAGAAIDLNVMPRRRNATEQPTTKEEV